MNAAHVIITLLFTLGMSEIAEAKRRSKRAGFNFGTSLRLISSDDRTFATEDTGKDTRLSTKSNLVSPYVGYAFGPINLGLVYTAETTESKFSEKDEINANESTRATLSNTKGLSFFTRFLFGNVFYFEGGAGLYQDKIEIESETRNKNPDGTFSGEGDKFDVSGIGPGYHLGAGFEIEMHSGFFFSTAYQVRIIQLRDHKGAGEFGAKRSLEQKREVVFGLAHYVR